MSSELHKIRARAVTLQEKNFKSSMHDLSTSVMSILLLLGQPVKTVTASALGSRLAHLLTSLRTHRKYAGELGLLLNNAEQLNRYLDGLHRLRASAAHWLTIHAANPGLIFVELSDFETQCWTTLGLGMVLLDDSDYQDFALNSALPSRFHQWWSNIQIRPDVFAA